MSAHGSVNRYGREMARLEELPSAPAWTVDAVCASTDPELFFPEVGGPVSAAARICAGCPVIDECLAYALAENIGFGVWGGLSANERRALRDRVSA